MPKTLKQACNCAVCGAPMAAGELFAWARTTRATVGGKVGGSHTLREVESFRPRHPHNCFAAQVEAGRQMRAAQVADYARARGATEAEIAEILRGG